MDDKTMNFLRERLGDTNYQKLIKIKNPNLYEFIAKYIELCNPDRVFVCNDSPEDFNYIRKSAIKNGEESPLAIPGHTVHFDNYYDQARDKKNTCILVSPGTELGSAVNTKDRDEGLREIHEILKNIMKGKELYILFLCLGPTGSEFSIPCVQLTDSSYVAHNEILLYRPGYDEFVKQGVSARFFKFVHSAGELDERKTCKNLDKRRIYIDLENEIVYSANTQYGGNTIGLKKLAMRLAIKRGSEEGWLTEHMFILGIHGPNNRVTYFTGAFPSLCGKTSTAMLEGETIVGDDIVYMRKKNGEIRAVNVEKGMFGIIQGINSKDDPILWKALHNEGEIIFSNVLVTEDKRVHWIGKDGDVPSRGYNHSGEWFIGKKDAEGKEIPCSHPNARFTLELSLLENVDPKLNDPEGVVVKGIVYGGRDSDTWLPVEEAFDWVHGIITKGASLESETTAATLGKEGVRKFNPMSNLDFLSIPIGKYIQINLDFTKDLEKPPRIFSVNYFLKDEKGNFLNEKTDKKIWYKWMELRVHDEVDAIETPTGRIPKYEDLQRLFKEVLNRDYSKEDYNKQFMIRIPENLAKIERIKNIYETQVPDAPEILFKVLEEQKQRLLKAREKLGDYITPDRLR
ncbi:phosphoenolpyruvate carboxykinase (GTP) [Candidatus Aminicenantes bacterium AC-335-K20]|jgi:phosphoenolpyruvate carboxykinase (GTP)|nr:phosphoenolpyruvate carboxykinase (GTP) [SCandidatus Aminicenantes bacterium Aminicenantia_JdfR_composite]MCP2596249.1 phosphoenolpyruvate carboxykinase (GTP) [Candidatus Aminicenantes bacterium AC-335-G13]MCP2597824.1 phosphoenolpyruvate carboxykinase (GTP) [Candidatus Aminicenantes bacterium AC-335-L06]MCP2606146.1 phosphoenolpyruvate carboxykinase (GTP) [Candidatus Aminicenantes bacterium AC-708-I09]MCP2619568.1 phosphoenolpyruvate carboxykinase (GTP) [Candidatus Aminicenantes bacterium A